MIRDDKLFAVRIAQITDLHLRHHQPGLAGINARRARLMPELFQEALNRIAQQEVDLIAVTGDLLDVPAWVIDPPRGFQMDDMGPWLEAAERDYRLLRRMLDAVGVPYIVLPGNHDDERVMWRVFDRGANTLDVAGFRVVRFCDHEHAGHRPRRFLDQRVLWESMLADADSPPQIHLQHYVVTPVFHEGYPYSYEEGESLARDIVLSGRVRLCLSGHYHAGTPLLHAGSTTFTTCPAFGESPFPWRVYEVSPAGVTMVEHALGQARLPRRRVMFLDRDGVINDLPSYRSGPEAMNLLPGVGAAIRRLREAGYAVVVITNQSAVGRGYVPEGVVYAVHDKMCRLLAQDGAEVDGIYFSTAAGAHAVLPRYVNLRQAKPRPTQLHQAVKDLHLDLEGGWMIGDRLVDIETAHNTGVRPILVRTGDGVRHEPTVRQRWSDITVVDDLSAAVSHILAASTVKTG